MKTTTKPSCRVPDYSFLAFVQLLRGDKINFIPNVSSDPQSNVVNGPSDYHFANELTELRR